MYELESVSEERKCYNHLTDNIYTVQIMTINDNTRLEKLIASYAFLETSFYNFPTVFANQDVINNLIDLYEVKQISKDFFVETVLALCQNNNS